MKIEEYISEQQKQIDKLKAREKRLIEALEKLSVYEEGCCWYDGDKIVKQALADCVKPYANGGNVANKED